MRKTQKISKVNVDRMYPFLCTKFQIFFNYNTNNFDNDTKEYIVDQDLIDYSYMANKTPPTLIPLFHKILKPSPPIKNPFLRFFKRIRLYFKYEKFFLKNIDPSLIRIGEQMILKKDKRKWVFKEIIVKRTENGVVSINNPNIFWTNEEFKYLRGEKIKSNEYMNCEFNNYKPTSL